MKRLLCAFWAFAALFASCTKEQAIDNHEADEIKLSSIPTRISASVEDALTKTSYTDEGVFSWAADDQIAVYYTGTDDNSNKVQGWLAYQVSELSNENKMAVFTLLSSESEKAASFEAAGFTPTGVAVYPVTSARPYAAYGNTMTIPYANNDVPIVTMKATGSTSIPNVGLTGSKEGEIYKFKTAGSVLKVTLNHIHKNATSISLVTNDKQNYPVTGDFVLTQTDGVYAYTFGTDGTYKYYNDFADRLEVPIAPATDDATITVYFNVPVGTYAADKLSVNIEEHDGECVRVISKNIRKSLQTNVNEVLTLPALDITYSNSSVAVTGSANTPQMTWTANNLRFCVLSTKTNDVSKYVSAMRFTNPENNRSWGLSGATYMKDGTATKSLTSSGKYYLHYVLKRESGDASVLSSLNAGDIIEYGTIPFYFLAASDVENYIGDYSIIHTVNEGTQQTSLTLAISDNANKGNIMLTEFAGTQGKYYGAYNANATSQNLVFYNTYNVSFTTNTYIYSPDHNLNLHLGYNRTDQDNYDRQAWDIIGWNGTTTIEVVEGSTSSFQHLQYLRGNVDRSN